MRKIPLIFVCIIALITFAILTPNPSCFAAVGCTDDAECDDGLFCNGSEICGTGTCLPGTPPDCDDGVACTVDTCDEVNDACVNTPDDASCDDGDVCNGVETCDPVNDCQPGEPLVCDDGNPCTANSCDPANGCIYTCAPENIPECEITIGDFVWDDTDGDGCQGEQLGIEGVTVNLIDCSAEPQIIASTLTDADGMYQFTVSGVNLAECIPISRFLQIEIQLGNYTIQDQECVPGDPAASDALDSDCDENGLTQCTEYPAGTNDDTVDCGQSLSTVEGCLTRTAGFWCNRPGATQYVLGDGLQVCGLTLDNVDVATQGSAIEDLTFGKDQKLSSPQQLQLIRQCVATALNIEASLRAAGNCDRAYPGITATFEACCVDLCTSGASGQEISASGCIEALDDFNNSDFMGTELNVPASFPRSQYYGPGYFPPGMAQSDRCSESNGNGFINQRP